MSGSSPARLFASLVGGALVIVGIIGFFYDASFATGDDLKADAVFGILDVNGWHNLVHIATGLVGLAAAGYAARTYALVVGLAYVLIAIWGFLETENGFGVLLDVIPVNTEDNFLHLIIGLTGLAAGARRRRKPRHSRGRSLTGSVRLAPGCRERLFGWTCVSGTARSRARARRTSRTGRMLLLLTPRFSGAARR